MLFELLVGFFTVLLVWDYLNRIRRTRIYNESGIKGPIPMPLIGNSYLLLNHNPESIFGLFDKFCKKYNLTFCVWLNHEAFIATAEANLMEAILSSQQVITKNNLYDLLLSWLGTGLLLSTGKKWFKRRKIITPTFHFKILEQFVEVFDQQSTIMVKNLSDRADGKTVINIFKSVCLAALDIITETAMGVKVHAQEDPKFPYVQAVQTSAEITSMRFIKPYQRFETSMRITNPIQYKKLKDSIDLMHKFAENIIEDRRKALEKSIDDGTFEHDEDEFGKKKRLALLDVLLRSTIAENGSGLSNEDIREEVDTFMFEGHDTTTSGISHALYLIARHPDVQKKLFEEIRSVIGDDKDKAVTMRDLQELKYLECVIKESLRLYPPVPIIGRYVQEDIILNGKLIPAKTNIIVLIYNAMRNPSYFPDPDDFKPERFDSSNDTKVNAFTYVPFSAGPRNCIGQKFAILEMKSTISKMLRYYELLPLGENVRPLMNLILRSATGTQLGLKPRVY